MSMPPNEVRAELQRIGMKLRNLRSRNKEAKWLCHILKGIEAVVYATDAAVDHTTRATK